MASIRSTFSIEESVLRLAREHDVNVSAAAREGVVAAIRAAMIATDRGAYLSRPESPDPFWNDAEAWSDE